MAKLVDVGVSPVVVKSEASMLWESDAVASGDHVDIVVLIFHFYV